MVDFPAIPRRTRDCRLLSSCWRERTRYYRSRTGQYARVITGIYTSRRLEVHYTPGHAIHHVIFFDAHSGELFAGDVAGVKLPGVDYVKPPTPPPDLDLEAWSDSISLLRNLRPDIIYLGHFGGIKDVIPHLGRLREKLS